MSSPSAAPPAIPGHEFESFISSGGFGDVFLYRDNIGRQVAIKVLHLAGLTDAAKEDFKLEAARMARLRNRFVVTVYGFGIADDGRPYISMEFCPDNLADRARQQTLSVADALRHTIRICSAVAAAHRADMFHRDVKPANVLLTHDGTPVLTDFGIASGRGVEDAASRGLSIRYAAPEVVEGASEGDEGADVYSIGATLYVLLTGRSPVDVPGGDNAEAALIQRSLDRNPPATGRADVPASLERVLARTLAGSPAHRFGSASELAAALREVEVELGFAPTEAPFEDPGAGPAAPVRRADDDESTRLRAPRRVAPDAPTARPDPPTARPGAPTAPPAPAADQAPQDTGAPSNGRPTAPDGTIVRGPGATPPAEAAPTPAEPAQQRSTPTWALVAAGVVVVAATVLVVVLAGGDNTPEPTPTAAPTSSQAPPDDALFSQPRVPADVAVQRTPDGVEVSWAPDPVDGVSYVVSVTEGPLQGEARQVDDTTTRLEDPDPAALVCVRVLAVLGSTSTEPSREECTR